MSAGLLGGILDTAVGQSTSFAQQGIDAQLNKKQREWMERREDLQYSRGWDVMEYQNFYNSPEQQMNRFRQAGLNPHLIFGKGTAGNTQSTPQMGNRGKYNNKVTPMANPSLFNNINQLRIGEEQVKNLKTQRKFIEQQTSFNKQKQANAFLDSQEKSWTIFKKMNQARYSGDFYKSQASKMKASSINELARKGIIDTQKIMNVAKSELLKKQIQFAPYQGSTMGIILKMFDEYMDKKKSLPLELNLYNGASK